MNNNKSTMLASTSEKKVNDKSCPNRHCGDVTIRRRPSVDKSSKGWR